MEIEEIQPDRDGSAFEESPCKELGFLSSPELTDVCGDRQLNPRVGNEYQVEIPPMTSESEHLCPFHSEDTVDLSDAFLMGLPVPITWAVHEKENNRENDRCGSIKTFDASIDKRGSDEKVKRKYIRKYKGSKLSAQSLVVEKERKEVQPASPLSKKKRKCSVDQLQGSKNYCPLPGLQSHPWSEADINVFVLGLYVFGKNFVQVKTFMDKKEMGDILLFYYGKFYRSDKHRRWSGCKKRRRKCVYGQKLFKGWRQQELLSRLHPHIPEHSQSNILEVSMAFAEGKFLFEDYISKLKDTVGIQALAEAIGIGNGKEDLTCLSTEPVKINPLFPVCPIGKACSSLTISDIIKLLTGNFRLSKARHNDIFWEAVWPRLLAKGWHSEQPMNQGYVDSKHHIVFLTPGVKIFSRRKLEKGNHYFDSVSDVLQKVASEPDLIKLDAEDSGGSSCNEEDGCVSGLLPNQGDPSVSKSFRYLKPQVSTCNMSHVKFTVVDSSLVHEGKLSKVREMRYSQDDLKPTSLHTTLSSKKQAITLQNPQDENKIDTSLDMQRNKNSADHSKVKLDDCGANRKKFTIVDTSLACGGKSPKVREIRYLLEEYKDTSELTNSLIGDGGDSYEDSLNEQLPIAAYLMSRDGKNVNKSNKCKVPIDSRGSNQREVDSKNTNKSTESVHSKKCIGNENQSTRTIKHQFSRRSKPSHSNSVVPLLKRRRLTACSETEIGHASQDFNAGVEPGSNAFEVDPDQKMILSSSSSVQGCSEEGRSAPHCHLETSPVFVEHQCPSSMDLNLPPATVDSENGKPVLMKVEDSQGMTSSITCFPSDSDKIDHGTASVDVDSPVKQLDMNPRRHSTRNRPLTTRALESLECEFLNVKKNKKKQKGTRVCTQGIAFPSPRKARSKVKVTPNYCSVWQQHCGNEKGGNENEACSILL